VGGPPKAFEFLSEIRDLSRKGGVFLKEMELRGPDLVPMLRRRLLVGLVPIRLAGLGEKDEGGGVRGLCRESQVKQDERVRVPLEADGERVECDPNCDYAVCPTM
jgi:hypothetical protein